MSSVIDQKIRGIIPAIALDAESCKVVWDCVHVVFVFRFASDNFCPNHLSPVPPTPVLLLLCFS